MNDEGSQRKRAHLLYAQRKMSDGPVVRGGWPEFAAWEAWMDKRFDLGCTGCKDKKGRMVICINCELRAWWKSCDGLSVRPSLYAAMQEWAERQQPRLVETYTTEPSA